jgi:hypothetical protein
MTQEDRIKVLSEINSYVARLPTDPNIMGIEALFKLASDATAYRERVSGILGEAIEDVKNAEKAKLVATFKFKEKRSGHLGDDTIKILKSADLRDAAISVILAAEEKTVARAELELLDATSFKDRLKLKYEDLKDVLRTLNSQLGCVDILCKLGAIKRVDGQQLPSSGTRLTNGD